MLEDVISRRPPRRPGAALVLALVLVGGAAIEAGDAPGQVSALSSDLRIRVLHGREIELEVRAGSDDDYAAVAGRVAHGPSDAAAIAAWNADRRVAEGEWIRVPLELLSDDWRRLVVFNLFPDDAPDGEDWVHVAGAATLHLYDEGLWQVAEWFTGRGSSFQALMEANGLSSPELREGQRIRIPSELLHASLRAGLRADGAGLVFRSDDRGPYAGYRLEAGEALYSAVVVRFTGRTAAEDVRELAELLRQRSEIPDLRDIPVGYEIRIPLDLLEPEYLPSGHPRRREAEAAEQELARALARQPVAGTRDGLKGVLVVLDPGHGGRDLGTMNNGIWEHDYVYDVACRLKEKLERETAARVVLTLEDKETGCVPSSGDKLKANRQGTILTTPPFLAKKEGEAKIGVNLRWYLANSIYRKAVGEGHDPDRVVFLSLHADSRHRSLSGAMVYVPGAAYRSRTYGHTDRLYLQFEEVKEKPRVRFSKKQRIRSEAVSREFASSVIGAFERENLPVQPHQPVRNRIIRGRSRFVPAVLRGNAIPNKVLVEMVNLSNPDDAALLASAARRDQVARALLRSLLDYFGEDPADVATTSGAG
jgi:N-acetylmuramoyl-L-alanine amidase